MSHYSGEELGWVSSVISAILGVSSDVKKTALARYDASVDASHAEIAREDSDAASAVNARRKAESDKKFTDIAKTGVIITAVVVAAVVLGTKGAKK